MELIWDKMWSVGVDKIDKQHRELFCRINLLVYAMRNGKKTDEILKNLNFLEEYVIRHFKDEEEIQKKTNYPKYEIQHREHEEFKNILKELRKVFESTSVSSLFLTSEQQKISYWWRKHIIEFDKDIGTFLMGV